MKIYSTTELCEFESILGEPGLSEIVGKPYYIERTMRDGKVIWFGQQINWIKYGDDCDWYNHEDEEVEEPIYEKLYKEYKNNSFNNLIEGRINGRIL